MDVQYAQILVQKIKREMVLSCWGKKRLYATQSHEKEGEIMTKEIIMNEQQKERIESFSSLSVFPTRFFFTFQRYDQRNKIVVEMT